MSTTQITQQKIITTTQTTIDFALGICSLGTVLVARNARGICAIFLGDDPDALILTLQKHFSHVYCIEGDQEFDKIVTQIITFIDAPDQILTLPLDIQGTEFKQRVWQALREIPCGATMSYSEIARHMGSPNATRAVANACAANILAVVIPCHRAVRSNGDLSGYRWGIERKAALLRQESKR